MSLRSRIRERIYRSSEIKAEYAAGLRELREEQEQDAVTLANIRARFDSPATSADIRNAVHAFQDGLKDWEVEQ